MTLEFEVNHQSICRTDNHNVVEGSKNYLTAAFSFSEEWDGLNKTAVFTHGENSYKVLLEDDSCFVPWEVIQHGELMVSVFGGDLITVNQSIVTVMESGLNTEAGEPAPPTPDVYEMILTTAQNAKSVAQSVRDDADSGKFNGAQGDKGDPGEAGHTPVLGVDYWTQDDKEKVYAYIDGQIGALNAALENRLEGGAP